MAGAANDQTDLIPMDAACLSFLLEQGGSFVTIAIPARMFTGEIPEGYPDLVDMGLIEHVGEITSLTSKGRDSASQVRRAA
jgi:hypothetical protein